MRKTVAILLAVMMVLSLAGTVFAQPPERPDVPGPKQSLVALGDSITAGYGLERNLSRVSRKAYPQLLGDEIGYRVTNLAVAGMTSGEVLEAVQSNNRYRNAIARADLIILNVGGADMLGFLYGVLEGQIDPITEGEQLIINLAFNVTSIIGEIKSLNPEVPILLFNIYEPYPVSAWLELESPEVLSVLLGFLGEVNGVIYNIAEAYESFFVDAYTAFEDYPGSELEKAALLFVDEVHPSTLGQVLLYNAAYEVLDDADLLYSRPMPPGLAEKAAMVQ